MTKKKAPKKLIEVVVTTLGRDSVTIRLSQGSTLSDALIAAGHGSDSLASVAQSARVNRQPADLGDRLDDGDEIMLAPNVKGGC